MLSAPSKAFPSLGRRRATASMNWRSRICPMTRNFPDYFSSSKATHQPQSNGRGLIVENGNCFIEGSDFSAISRLGTEFNRSDTAARLRQLCERWIYSVCLCFALSRRSGSTPLPIRYLLLITDLIDTKPI
jgi:hypothetical protein